MAIRAWKLEIKEVNTVYFAEGLGCKSHITKDVGVHIECVVTFFKSGKDISFGIVQNKSF